jgi:hypothetical protein
MKNKTKIKKNKTKQNTKIPQNTQKQKQNKHG